MEHTKHLWRAFMALVALLVTVVFARHFMVPESFGVRGHYRADSLDDYMALAVHHGESPSCRACHEEEADEIAESKHAPVPCESCHGPLSSHAAGEEKIGEALVDKSSRGCLVCHEKLAARDANFPQVSSLAHVRELGDDNTITRLPPNACLECHEAHAPGM